MGNKVEKEFREELSEVNPDDIPELPWLNKKALVYVYSVTDGDTFKVLMSRNNELFKFSILLDGVKTPRIIRCSELEKKAGLKVRKYVQGLIENKTIFFFGKCLDNFANRIRGDVFVNCSNQETNLVEHLISKGYAKQGEWTQNELNRIIEKN